MLVERSLLGWYEIEFEVLRDAADTTIAICGMENLDPMGVHTGDSIVVAPIQTLPDPVVQRLRRCALKIVRALRLEGGCNVQLAVSPDGADYRVIEVNPRVSRSSALASKATGYPIARLAALVGLGKRLDELPNPATGIGSAAFEPAVDYVVVKLPRWPFDKFPERGSVAGRADEGHRRGDGHRPRVRPGAAEGGPVAGAARPWLDLGGPGLGADASASRRPRPLPGTQRHPAVAHGRPPAPWLDRCRRAVGGQPGSRPGSPSGWRSWSTPSATWSARR